MRKSASTETSIRRPARCDAAHDQILAQVRCQRLDAARASLQLYGGHPAVDFAGLAAEVATEIRLLRAICAELAIHAAERESRYRQVDPPGLAEVGGPALVARMGRPGPVHHRQEVPLLHRLGPRASETGETDRKGQPMSKAGSSLLRTTLVRAADTARKQDPQLARTHCQQMTERGKDHLGALCVVAASLGLPAEPSAVWFALAVEIAGCVAGGGDCLGVR